MRARYPDRDGYVDRDGVKVFFEVYGQGDDTIVFLPTWSIVHSRIWKAQIPTFARDFRVVTFDGRGNGGSDRPLTSGAYDRDEFVADALAVMDATDTAQASLVSLSMGAEWALMLAARYPERVTSAVFVGPGVWIYDGQQDEENDQDVTSSGPETAGAVKVHEGWDKYSAEYWRMDYPGFLEFFFGQVFHEEHSTKQIEDAIGWGLDTDPETLILTDDPGLYLPAERVRELCAQVRCPVLVVTGDEDRIVSPKAAAVLAELTGGRLVTFHGSGHCPHARDPVPFNFLVREFLGARPGREWNWSRGSSRGRRAMFVSSPIGLGHAQRDVAIARELKTLVPDLEIEWLAQDPVTRVLATEGETIHPASELLANESSHIESETAEHDLHCFQALRRMDEILVANFMLFHDVVEEGRYDLWICDEAWDVDHFLHENPERKSAALAWLTDFVGFLPMPDGGADESFLTSDYNAEMIEHIERFPRVRDRAIFVGDPEDIVPDRFGQDLPQIRSWTEEHFAFSGYVTGFDPIGLGDREELRAELGYAPDERVCVATVGGSAVGGHLLGRVMEAFPAAKRAIPELRMIAVAGPRIDVESLPTVDGLEVRPFVPGLYRHLAACDVAIVQGGLTTCMELTANRRPFIYVPLRHHFEQRFHVRHRLERYGAGTCVEFDQIDPDRLADQIVSELGREPDYLPVDPGGAARAASMIAELL